MKAESMKNMRVRLDRLTDGDGHQFYGYYDNPAWSGNDRYHLYHKVPFWNRLQASEDLAELGMIDTVTKQYAPLAQTTAWNFQQGSMLQWHPLAPDEEILFNTFWEGKWHGVVMHVQSKEQRFLAQPITNVDPTGKYALSVNFSRMFDFRPGYGYAQISDPFSQDPHPAGDGIYLTDLSTGLRELILSLQQIWDFTKDSFGGQDSKIMINHINFNTDGSRFVCLIRNFPDRPGAHWKTAILTAKHDGTELFLLSDYSYASHYHWRDPEHLVIYSKGAKVLMPVISCMCSRIVHMWSSQWTRPFS